MTGMADHAKPEKHRDHLWVAVIIAACALLEVWASWLGIGAVSGFPHLGKMTTGWILPVTTEAYWGYALYAWLAGSPGPRSRKFAMWTAIVMFCLSLTGQEAGHLVASGHGTVSPFFVGLVTALPLITLGLIAILIHLRQADREEAAAAAEAREKVDRQDATERAEADERTALRAELEAAREDLAAERAARTEAQQEAALRAGAQAERDEAVAALEAAQGALQAAETARAEAERQAERLETKAATLARKLDPNGGAKGRKAAPAKDRNAGGEPKVPNDVDARAEALRILAENPNISGAKLGELCGKSERWGQLRKSELVAHVAGGEDGADGEAGDR